MRKNRRSRRSVRHHFIAPVAIPLRTGNFYTMKATSTTDRRTIMRFQQIPNVGPATTGDFRVLDIATPQDLIGRDPYAMYDTLCARTGHRHDPCVIDVFIAAMRFMEGAPSAPWYAYTAERKVVLARLAATSKA